MKVIYRGYVVNIMLSHCPGTHHDILDLDPENDRRRPELRIRNVCYAGDLNVITMDEHLEVFFLHGTCKVIVVSVHMRILRTYKKVGMGNYVNYKRKGGGDNLSVEKVFRTQGHHMFPRDQRIFPIPDRPHDGCTHEILV